MRNTTKSLYTKLALSNALKDLLEEHSLDKITIKRITDECGFNRQTFYYHFEDIYGILIWMFRHDIVPLIENLEGETLWKEGLEQIFTYLDENKKICAIILKTIDRTDVYDFFSSSVKPIVDRTVDMYINELGISTRYRSLISDYYILSIGSILEAWVLDQIDYEPDEIILFLDNMLADQILGITKRYTMKKMALR